MPRTAQRVRILRAVTSARGPLSAREVLARLGRSRCNRVTVYRALRTLASRGVLRQVDHGDGVRRYEAASAVRADACHHHLVCRACERVVEVDGCGMERLARRVARASGFREVEHRLALVGLCGPCGGSAA